jgi:hypothetical protein
MNRTIGIALVAVATLAPTGAHASDKQDFERCDGRVHPGKQDDGMRGAASTGRFSALLGAQSASVEACTRALASPRLLPTQTLRRAHLLRARAAAHLQAGATAKAVEDLDQAEAATAALASDRFFQRSMAVSVKLLRALAKAQSDDLTGAVPLAQAAMQARPYSLQVQQVAAGLLQAARPVGAASASPWLSVSRLDPSYAATALIKEAEVGNFTGVLSLRPAVTLDWPAAPVKPVGFALRDTGMQGMLSALLVSLHTAYARAATGDTAGAKRDLAELRTRLAALRAPADAAAPAAVLPALWTGIDRYVELRTRQVEARVAVAEGRAGEAVAALIASPMPRDAATVDLLKAMKTAMPAKDAALVPDAAPFEAESLAERRKSLAASVPAALIAPETPRAVVDYERARPNILGALVAGALSMGTSLLGGIDRTDGFRSTNNPDGTIKVEFIGNTPSAALVQEMTLLRAAEVAKAAGKPSFVIVDRKDFTRRLSTTQYGTEISSVPTGYKTELTIRCVDAGTDPARALDAIAIIDALGPLYYETKPVKT